MLNEFRSMRDVESLFEKDRQQLRKRSKIYSMVSGASFIYYFTLLICT